MRYTLIESLTLKAQKTSFAFTPLTFHWWCSLRK